MFGWLDQTNARTDMFTGMIEATGTVRAISSVAKGFRLRVDAALAVSYCLDIALRPMASA